LRQERQRETQVKERLINSTSNLFFNSAIGGSMVNLRMPEKAPAMTMKKTGSSKDLKSKMQMLGRMSGAQKQEESEADTQDKFEQYVRLYTEKLWRGLNKFVIAKWR
jgi:uncharacterized membrane protein